jgi:uncharacterized protein YqeY
MAKGGTMLTDTIRERIIAAIKSKNMAERDILKYALSEIQAVQSRLGEMNDDTAIKIVRKIIEKNTALLTVPAMANLGVNRGAKLVEETERDNAILNSVLPALASAEQIRLCLNEIAVGLTTEPNEGKAIGWAMKKMKETERSFDGATVKQVVQKMRGESKVGPIYGG